MKSAVSSVLSQKSLNIYVCKQKCSLRETFFIACTEFLCFVSSNRMFAEGEDGFIMTPSNVDKNGAYLIDRSPTYFEPILNYLRNGQLIFDNSVNPEGRLFVEYCLHL